MLCRLEMYDNQNLTVLALFTRFFWKLFRLIFTFQEIYINEQIFFFGIAITRDQPKLLFVTFPETGLAMIMTM